MGLLAYQQILTTEPASEEGLEGIDGASTARRSSGPSSWRCSSPAPRPRARRPAPATRAAEAGEIYEQKLNDVARARELFAAVLAEDPGHAKASDAMARIAERTGDFKALVAILERRAEARRGREKADALLHIGEIYEDQLEDLAEATKRFEAVLALEPNDLQALKGLDRILQPHGQVPRAARQPRAPGDHRRDARDRRSTSTSAWRGSTTRSSWTTRARPSASRRSSALDPANDARADGAAPALPRAGRVGEARQLYEKHANVTATTRAASSCSSSARACWPITSGRPSGRCGSTSRCSSCNPATPGRSRRWPACAS